ncbi:DUF5995 family protein [Marivirga tractuosa]|uniref:DUF5995 family protein n=1 Tax=Marivirga tractuosa TaxID=1006 RepID=UPI0035D07BEC
MQSVETLLSRMDDHIESWEKTRDNRYVFLRCYNMMSANMYEAVKQGKFTDSEWVTQLLVRFSEYYFEALDHYDQVSLETPKVWKQVHDCTCQQKLHVLQNLLIGVNAHINYDLPLALYDCLEKEWHTSDELVRASRKRDHQIVNIIIGETIDAVQDDVIAPMSPAMAVLDKLMGRMDEWLLSRLITGWRGNVWKVTQDLLHAATPEEQEIIRQKQEAKVVNLSNQIIRVI